MSLVITRIIGNVVASESNAQHALGIFTAT